MTNFRISTFILLIFSVLTENLFSQSTVFSTENLRENITFLASDKLQGRGTGTKQEVKAAKFLAKKFKKIGLQPAGDDGSFFHHFTFKKADPHGNIAADAPVVNSQNVAAFLDNGAENTIIIGAHYDHLGLGHDHNSLEANSEGMIHNGADDNASGTAGVLELARYFSENGKKEAHNFLFLCFSGEELGLVGSKKFAENPTRDLSKASFMLNMDMIGRLNPEKRLMVGGVGTAPDFVPAIKNMVHGLTIKLDSSGIGPSDHTSFYLKNIPVLFVFTGQHSDYHKPSDDTEKINFPGVVEVLDFARRLVERLDETPKLKFQETKTKKEDTPSFKVTLGIMPDYVWDGEGVHVDGVTTGRPGEKAGLQKGDVILGLGDIEVKNIQDYMKGLSKFQKGESAPLKIKRGEEVKMLQVTF